jgi:hypothetical protein
VAGIDTGGRVFDHKTCSFVSAVEQVRRGIAVDAQFFGSTPQRVAPARYGSGCGLPFETSFEVTMPHAGSAMAQRASAAGA